MPAADTPQQRGRSYTNMFLLLQAVAHCIDRLTCKQGTATAQYTWQWLLTVMSMLQGILHSCANAVKQKRLPARPLSHTACTISACSPPTAVSACPALNVGCQDLQAQCVPNGLAVASQVQCFVHLGHASTDSLTACKVIVMQVAQGLFETPDAGCL